MARFHVSQDEAGYFQLTYENDQGELTLISDQFDEPTQLIEDATERAASGEFGDATVLVAPQRRAAVAESAAGGRPAPRRAGE
jgi:hypothetical protein